MTNQNFRRTVAGVQITMLIVFGVFIGVLGAEMAKLAFKLFTM